MSLESGGHPPGALYVSPGQHYPSHLPTSAHAQHGVFLLVLGFHCGLLPGITAVRYILDVAQEVVGVTW